MTTEKITEEGHDQPYHTEACFQRSNVVECFGGIDTRECSVCGKRWTEACNFDEDFA